ncbi:MAG: hypothetical protein LBN36_08980 [Clostridiales Family XIII bacterium]|jgi:hypothetical protein|nr:hypothetical protein [Clostridiales Family XIII bacterium]
MMEQRYDRPGRGGVLWLVLLFILLFFAACAPAGSTAEGSGGTAAADASVRFLSIEGDVAQNVIKNSGTPVKNDGALPGDADFEGIPLTDFIAEAGISGDPKTIYLFSSGDGFVSSIDYEGAEEVYVIFSAAKGWSLLAPNHPPAASGMDIDRIIVVSESSEVGLSVVAQDGRKTTIPMGQLLLSPQHAEFRLDGISVNNEGSSDERAVALYTRQYSVVLSDIDAQYTGIPFVVATADGETYLTDGTGRFILYRQKINYKETTGDVYEDVVEIRLR